MQQGFGIVLLADEVVRSRREGVERTARQARDAAEARREREARRRGQEAHRGRRLAVRLAGFVIALSVMPAGREAAVSAEGGAR